MADIRTRITLARRRVTQRAFARWQKHADARDRGLASIRHEGIGAADTAKRREQYVAREARRATLSFAALRILTSERAIGGWDATFTAPSEQARKIARSVARIVLWPGDGYSPVGLATGVLVSPNLLLTNHHVIPERVDAKELAANFEHVAVGGAVSEGALFRLDADKFYFSHEELDFALVGIDGNGSDAQMLSSYSPLPLIEATGKTLIGKPINIVQHPKGGPRQYAVTNNRLVDILEEEGFLHYETDTDRGSSGSPVFNENWEIIGLHHCGVPEMEGGQVMTLSDVPFDPNRHDDDDISWIANEGTRTSFIVAALRTARFERAQDRDYVEEVLTRTADPLGPAVPMPANIPALERNDMATVFNISGNVTINVSGDQASVAKDGAAISAANRPALAAFQEKTQNFDERYAERRGYNALFLGVEVPAPVVTRARLGEIYAVRDYSAHAESTRNVPEMKLRGMNAGDPLAIPYYHYSLQTNKTYRMAMWTALNADYRAEARGDTRPRSAFGGENWRLDRRVPTKYQLTDAQIYQPAKNFDRGHLVRREDAAHGPKGVPTEHANADTYHWTNCTPQHELFNQESPDGAEYKNRKGVWGFFEGELAEQIEQGGGQAIIFAGPVLQPNLPKKDFGKGPVLYPNEYWKVVIVPADESRSPRLLAYGYVFDQSKVIKEFGLGLERALDLPQFKKYRRSLRQITEMSGIEFADALYAVDQPS